MEGPSGSLKDAAGSRDGRGAVANGGANPLKAGCSDQEQQPNAFYYHLNTNAQLEVVHKGSKIILHHTETQSTTRISITYNPANSMHFTY